MLIFIFLFPIYLTTLSRISLLVSCADHYKIMGSVNPWQIQVHFSVYLRRDLNRETVNWLVFFKKIGQPWASFRLFLVFSNNQYNFYNKSMWKMSSPSSIWCRDSNPRLLEHESSPITTRPGLPPYCWLMLFRTFLWSIWASVCYLFKAFKGTSLQGPMRANHFAHSSLVSKCVSNNLKKQKQK